MSTAAPLAILDLLLPLALRAQPAARHLALLGAVSAAAVPVMMLLYHWLGFDAGAVAVLACGVAMAGAPALLHAGLPLARARDLFIGALFVLKIWLAIHLGGLGAPTTAWFILCPLVAALVGGVRPALLWSALVLKAYLLLYLWSRIDGAFVAYPVTDPQALAAAGQLGLLAMVTVLALCLAEARER